MTECPEAAAIADYVDAGRSDDPAIKAHLGFCESCQALVGTMETLRKLGIPAREIGSRGSSERRPSDGVLDELKRQLGPEGCPTPYALHLEASGGSVLPSLRSYFDDHLEECTGCKADYSLMSGLHTMGVDASLPITRANAPLFLVFMDESGAETKSFEPKSRKTLHLASVITTAAGARKLQRLRRDVVRRFGLPSHTEIHANPCLLGQDEFETLSPARREELLITFLQEGRQHYLFHSSAGMLKHLVQPRVRKDLRARGLSQYGAAFLMTVFLVGNYLPRALGGRFRFIFDRSDPHTEANLVRVVRALRERDPDAPHCSSFVGQPRPLDSKLCAAIQLADVIAHYDDRHHQLYYGKFDHDPRLEPYRERIQHKYDSFLRAKELPVFSRQLRAADWDVLSEVNLGESDGAA